MTEDINSDLAENPEKLWEVIIDDGSEESDFRCMVEVDAPDAHYEETRYLVLSFGGRPKQTDRLVETYGDQPGPRFMVTDDAHVAVGMYLHLLELHDVEENGARDGVRSCADDLAVEYEDWRDSLSVRDCQLRLLDQAEADDARDEMGFYSTALARGSWRDSGLSEGARRLARNTYANIDANPKFCYQNARQAVERNWDNDRVQYVEGIALPSHAARITGHAWVEIDGAVAEMTWPWHAVDPPEKTAYFGVEVGRDRLREAQEAEDDGPLVLSVDDPSKLG